MLIGIRNIFIREVIYAMLSVISYDCACWVSMLPIISQLVANKLNVTFIKLSDLNNISKNKIFSLFLMLNFILCNYHTAREKLYEI